MIKIPFYTKIIYKRRKECLPLKFYDNANELVTKELPRSVRSQLYPFFHSGVIAYQEVVNNSILFRSEFMSNLKGRLLNYMIFRQFEPDMVSSTFPFKTNVEKVNNFNYKTLNLSRGNIIINVAKANDKNSLPSRSKYRLKKCNLNKFYQKQLFCQVKTKEMVVTNEPYYAFLTYGFRNNEIDFVNLVVPNDRMTGILKKVDLMSEFSLYKSEVPQEEIEKRITSLNQHVIEELNNKLMSEDKIKSDGEGDEQ